LEFLRNKLLEGNTTEGILAAQIMWSISLSGFSLVRSAKLAFDRKKNASEHHKGSGITSQIISRPLDLHKELRK
jgi:hypothetical protein